MLCWLLIVSSSIRYHNWARMLYMYMLCERDVISRSESSQVWTPLGSRDNCLQRQHLPEKVHHTILPRSRGAGEVRGDGLGL